jgi:putative peptidoglycan lipid II flippase
MASRLTGFVREMVLSWLFGAGAVFDAYVLAFRIPNLARELFAEGALASAFIPTFTRCLTTQGPAEARKLANISATMLLLITGAVTAVGIIFAPVFVDLFAPGYHAVPGKFELAVSLMRTMFPFLVFLALAAQAQGTLFACHRFGIAAISPALFNIASVLAGLTLGYWFGWATGLSRVRGMAIGVVVGGAAQLAVQLPSVWRAGFGWRPQWNLRANLRNEGVRHILWLMGPAMIGNASGQINVLVTTNFAAGLRDAAGEVMNGPVSWLAYAYRFFALPLGIFGVAIASATLPRISRSAARNDLAEFRDTLSRSVAIILLLTIPSSVGLAIFGERMIGLVYQHGRFHAFDTQQTALALTCYAAGLAGYAALKLIAPAFYALGDSRTPMMVSIASVMVNALTAFAMIRYTDLGHAGLALAASVVSTFSAVTLLILLRPRIGGINGRRLAVSGLKIVLAAGAMGLVCHAVSARVPSRVGGLALGIPVGVATFWMAAGLLRIEELNEASQLVMRKLGFRSTAT